MPALGVLENDLDSEGDALSASLLSDPANGILLFSGDGSFTYSPNPDFEGTDSFSYTASDGSSTSAPATVTLDVIPANESPVCTNAYPQGGIWIWPPNNNVFIPVQIQGLSDPEGDALTITITSIYQDEAVAGGGLTPDGMGIGTDTAQIRAERDGNGNGRVYHIFFSASDGLSQPCEGKVRVGVFDSQGGGALDPIDGGALYDSTGTHSASLLLSTESVAIEPAGLVNSIYGANTLSSILWRKSEVV